MQRPSDASTPARTVALSAKAIPSTAALQSPQASPRGQIPIASAAPPPPTSRDFVPWRFSDAGRHSAWMASSCRRPRNLHTTRLMHRSNDEAMSSFRQACGLQSPGGYLIAEFWAWALRESPRKTLAASRVQARPTSLPGNERRSVVRSFSPKLSNLDLSAKFHHLSRGHAEEGCGAFGVVLQKCEESLAPYCHAHDLVTRDDRLAADIVSDICGIDAA